MRVILAVWSALFLALVLLLSTSEAEAQCPPGMVCIPQSQLYGGGFGGGYTGSYSYPALGGPAPYSYGYQGYQPTYSGQGFAPAPLVADSQSYPFVRPSPYGNSCNGGGFYPQSFPGQPWAYDPYTGRPLRSLSLSLRD